MATIFIDSNEPKKYKDLSFGKHTVVVTNLQMGDYKILTDEGQVITIERKTASDFIASIQDGRAYQQAAAMGSLRSQSFEETDFKEPTKFWPYFIITGTFLENNGKVETKNGRTGFSYWAAQGARLDIREMGVYIYDVAHDDHFEKAVMTIINRKRDRNIRIVPAKDPVGTGLCAEMLMTLPRIGKKKANDISLYCRGNIADAFCAISDLSFDFDIPGITKNLQEETKINLGLLENEILMKFGIDKEKK